MKYYFIFFLIAFFIFSCKSGSVDIQDLNPIDSILLPHGAYPNIESISFGHSSSGEIEIAYVDSIREKISVINKHGKEIDSLNIPKIVTDNRLHFSYKDKKFVLFSLTDNMYIESYRGNCVKYAVSGNGNFLSSMFANFEVVSGRTLFYQIPLNSATVPKDKDGFFDIKILGVYGLANDTFKQKQAYLTYPRLFQTLTYPETPPVCNLNAKNELWYLFSFSDSLTVVDLQSGKSKNMAINNLRKCRIAQYCKDSMGILSYAKRQTLVNEMFSKLLFDDGSQDAIIIRLLGITKKENAGLFEPVFSDKPVSVYVINNKEVKKTFNLINYAQLTTINSYLYNKKLYISNISHDKIYVYNM